MPEECKECERTAEELSDLDIELYVEGFCHDCWMKMEKVWREESEELNRYWRETRL